MVATGGMEKKLRIFDLALEKPQPSSPSVNSIVEPVTIQHRDAHEIGEGVHKDAIKFIVWTMTPTVLITASGKILRWFDIPSKRCVQQVELPGEITSCERVSLASNYSATTDIGGGSPVLAVASGKTVSFWGGETMSQELNRFDLGHGAASVGLDLKGRKFVVGEEPGTWVRVYSWDDSKEIGKYCCCPGLQTARLTCPQMSTRVIMGRSGRFISRPTASCTQRALKMALSRCGRTAMAPMASGERRRARQSGRPSRAPAATRPPPNSQAQTAPAARR